MMLWQLLLILLTIWSVHYRWTRRRIYQLSKQIKCDLIALPIIGHAYMFIGGGTDHMKALQQLGREAIKQNGLTHVWLGPKFFIMLADPVNLELVLTKCLEKDDVMNCLRLGTGNGSIFAPVSIWRPRRKIIGSIFSMNNLIKFDKTIYKNSNIMMSMLKEAPKGSFPIWDYFTTYTLYSAAATVLGYETNLQEIKDQVILKPFKVCAQMASERILKPWLHPLAVYKMTPQYTTFMKYKEAGCDLLSQIIESKRQAGSSRINDEAMDNSEYLLPKTDVNTDCKSILNLAIERGGENGLTDLELQEEMLVLILAGTDSSAVGASYTTLMLSRHQDVQEKVYKELMEVLGDSTDRPILANDLSRLKYLDAVIRESLRLHPPVPVIVRKVETDLALPSAITLVKGCGIVVNIWAVNRNPKYWGSDADEFRPERFFEDYDKRAFMAFSAGPRNCIGTQLAMMSMKTVLASLIRQYRVLPAEEDIIRDGPNITYKPIEETYQIMMKDVNSFVVQLESRS